MSYRASLDGVGEGLCQTLKVDVQWDYADFWVCDNSDDSASVVPRLSAVELRKLAAMLESAARCVEANGT